MPPVTDNAPILRPAGRVLLLRAKLGEGEVWITPGGTFEPGETAEQAASRQLWEETGVENAELSPCVWTRTHQFAGGGRRYEQQERFFVARAAKSPVTLDNCSAEELQLLSGWRWWT